MRGRGENEVALWFVRSITHPVRRGVRVLEQIAAGDLTRRMNLDQRDEIGRLGTASDQMAGDIANRMSTNLDPLCRFDRRFLRRCETLETPGSRTVWFTGADSIASVPGRVF